MKLGYEGDLYILAFDHRGSFQKKMFGIGGNPSPDQQKTISDAKSLIFEGFETAVKDKLAAGAGVLVDEESGPTVAKRAKQLGVVLAMPCEKSGQDEFDFEYAADFRAHIEKFLPTFCKVLVRGNVEDDPGMNGRQAKRLATLSDYLHGANRRYMFELLVPATRAQLDSLGGDKKRYEAELRPGLMVAAIEYFQDHGVEPDVWKIEGLDRREDCQRIVAAARRGGRDRVGCIVLGRGENERKVREWLSAAAGVPGYIGFAVGRTTFWDALVEWRAGKLERAAAVSRVAASYKGFVDLFERAA